MKFHLRTLGCKMNQLDSARLHTALLEAGHEAVASEEEADYAFVNTCTVTAQADRKSRKGAGAAERSARQVAVLGCSVRIDAPKWQSALPDALVFDNDAEMYRYFGADPERITLPVTSRTRLPIAIQTGCDDTCRFCITTLARGAHRSLPIEEITEQVQQAHQQQIAEVVLTGINLAAWGSPDSKHEPQSARLHQLLETLLIKTSIPRIRLSSLGPQYLHEGFWEVYADRRICDYLHLSVQSGCDSVLSRMDRGHGTAEVINIAEQSRRVRPGTALAADFI
ncbi:MAG: radical SAM protein, partial [Gammaproteobacteria bacterium]